jgi:outer membrane immunogenic protein
MINRTLIASVALLAAGLSQAAYSQTLSSGTGWSGLYYGINAGYNYNTLTVNDRDYFNGFGDNSTHSNGAVLGGQVGYNWQTGALVYGVEADIDGLTTSKVDNNGENDNDPSPYGQIVSKLNALGTIRGRIGIAADPALLYLTGGVAMAHVSDAYSDFDNNDENEAHWSTKGGVRVGVIGGAGVEWHAGSRQTWKVEGLLYNLGEKTVSQIIQEDGPELFRQSFSNSGVMMRVGLNFR